jgi:hypothetical protein
LNIEKVKNRVDKSSALCYYNIRKREREVLKMNKMECEKYDMIVELGIATPEEINLVANVVGGRWNDILDSVVLARTGYQTFEDYLADEMEE